MTPSLTLTLTLSRSDAELGLLFGLGGMAEEAKEQRRVG